ncbi:MAG TPA: MFS transporter [Mycobacteriales bacterium]|jgi:EmrB/QacA subfamily drug resistance transporter|nr:MFS transporter [Mycobacteriales bacterium]
MTPLGRDQRRALIVVCAILALTVLDTTVVSVALGSIQTREHAGVTSLQWIVDAYALTFASLMLTGGTMGDRFGRKRLMLIGIAVFSAGSVMGALAPSVGVLIAARAVMGVGAAAAEPGTLSVIRHLFPDRRERARALGLWAGVSCLGLALGPIVGGILVGLWDWRGVFWFNVAAGIVLLAFAWRRIPESADPEVSAIDVPGQILAVLTLAAVIVAVIQGETSGYTDPVILGLFAVASIAGGTFVRVERAAARPMLDLHYFRLARFDAALTVAFAVYFGTFSIFFFTALYLQEVVGYTGYRTAVLFLPMAASMVFGAWLAGRLVSRRGGRWTMTGGCLIAAAGILASEPLIVVHPSFGPLAVTLAVAGLGIGAAIVPVTATVLELVPAEHSGMAASTTNTARQLGVVFGVAVLGALVNAHLTTDLSARLERLGIPATFQSIVINAVERGTVPSGGNAPGSAQSYGTIVNRVISAAYGAFRSGLTTALITSAVLIALAGAFAAYAARRTGSGLDASDEVGRETATADRSPALDREA